MTLAAGTRLGPYEILGPVGAGGMGEVYRAEDRRLNRAVAIKVLHPHLAARGGLKQRFDREARVISSLSHPHICRLYDVGSDRGLHYLVMEYLEGETLARRLQRGPLSLAQALQYAIQIGEALDRAHRSGIVHRDVKPGNIILTKDGVKVLDFGLAKLAADKRRSDADTEAELTQEGVLLGTYSYMAPEQREGKEADARTDIFALGEIVYEMLTGAKASKNESTGKTITPSAEPEPITRRWPQIPPALDHIVRTCLARDPDARWQTVHDVLIALRWVRDSGALTSPRPTARSRNKIRKRALVAAIALAAAVVMLVVLASKRFGAKPPEPRPIRFVLAPPAGVTLWPADKPAVSPDGRSLVFTASGPDGSGLLWVRALDSVVARPLPGTETATLPFWSPDSRSVAFYSSSDEWLKQVDISGGPPKRICRTTPQPGGTWGGNG